MSDTSLTAAVIARLDAEVADLRSVEGAAAFATIVERRAWPQVTPAAYVVPEGLRGLAPSAGAGAFVQPTQESVSVLLVVRPHDRVGAAGIEPIEALKRAVLRAVAGWGPQDAMGQFRLTRGATRDISGGAIVYQIEFAIDDQLRIIT